MRILHIIGNRKLPRSPETESASGVVRATLELARAQVRIGHRVSIAAIDQQAWNGEWDGVQLLVLAAASWAHMPFGRWGLDLRSHAPYVRLALSQHFDIVQGHIYAYMRFLRARARVVHFHCDPFFPGREKDEHLNLRDADFRLIARTSQAQIAVSNFVAEELRKGLCTAGNIQVVHNGVDFNRFGGAGRTLEGIKLRQRLGLHPDDTLFLFAGAIVPEKGVVHMVRAFTRMASERPEVHIALAGSTSIWGQTLIQDMTSDTYEANVLDLLKQDAVKTRVHLLGKVGAADMPAVYVAADVVVVPSVWREAFGLVAVEALASGRPVIASATGGLVEIVNERNGILVPPGDEAALELAMRALASDRLRRMRLAQAAPGSVRNFSWERAARQLDDIYSAILKTEVR